MQEELHRDAQIALYRSKARGGRCGTGSSLARSNRRHNAKRRMTRSYAAQPVFRGGWHQVAKAI